MKAAALAVTIAALGPTGFAPRSQDAEPAEDPAAALRKVVDANLAASNREDIDAILATLHPKSPGYAATKQMTSVLIEQYDLEYKLNSFRYVGRDADYAIARCSQDTTRKAGGEFRNNTVDVMHIFRKDGKDWKLWTTAILDVKYAE